MSVTKSEKAFKTITEAASVLELPAHVLRFWESKFKQIKPMKRGGGRRYYRPEDIHLLLGIKELLYSQGLTIKGAQKLIQSDGIKSVVKIGTGALSQNGNLGSETANKNAEILTEVSTQTFSIKNIKNIHSIDPKKLKNVLEKLQQIRCRIKTRYKKKLVA